MKQCLGGRLTQLEHENGRTSHPRPRITSVVWKTMLVCQVNLSVDVHLRMPQQTDTALWKCSIYWLEITLFGQEGMKVPVVLGLMGVSVSLSRSSKGWCSADRSAVLQRAPSCCWQGFNQRKDTFNQRTLFLANVHLLSVKTLGSVHRASVCS